LTAEPRRARRTSSKGGTRPANSWRRPPGLAALTLALMVGGLVAAGAGDASICICVAGRNPALRVNAKGFAEVSWTSQGSRHYRVITPRGRVVVGRMTGRDVSTPTTAVRIPYKRALRRTPPGAFWALQSWGRPGQPLNLRFSRWRGKSTRLTAETVCCRAGQERLRGRATFHDTPIYGWVYVDCYGCALNPRGWAAATRAATDTAGFYSVRIRSAWRGARYRVSLVGPRARWMRTPDARAFARSSL
jgi:hypothetical protein